MKEAKEMKDMKAVILEISEGKAIVLDKSGRYHKIPADSWFEVGCEMILPQQLPRRRFKPAKAVSIAAAFIIVVSSLGAYTYSLPYSYMEVDINPSVQFTANIYNRIIKVESFNVDGEDIITGESYRNMSLKNGLSHLLEKAEEKGYISGDKENAVLVTVSSRSKNKANHIIMEADTSIKRESEKENDEKTDAELNEDTGNNTYKEQKSNKGRSEISTAVVAEEIPMKLRQRQLEQSAVSPGKNALVEKLTEENPDLNAEELKNAPVKELVNSIMEIRKQEEEEEKKQKEEERQKAKESREKEKEDREKAKQEEKERKQQEKEDKEREKYNKGKNRGKG